MMLPSCSLPGRVYNKDLIRDAQGAFTLQAAMSIGALVHLTHQNTTLLYNK